MARRPEAHVSLFQMHSPNLDECCICDKPVTGRTRHIEERPTGAGFRIQKWAYCLPCWDRHRQICGSPIDATRLLSALTDTTRFGKRT